MNSTINRYNQDGSENLDYWFGTSSFTGTEINISNKHNTFNLVISTPRYVRYTLDSLKKRSTKRLETMHLNIFNSIADRKTMIENLYIKLNSQWDNYLNIKTDQFGISYIDNTDFANAYGKGRTPKGRPMVFQTEQQVAIVYTDYLSGSTLSQLSKKYGVNIATLSQTFNGIGKYGNWLFGDESEYMQ